MDFIRNKIADARFNNAKKRLKNARTFPEKLKAKQDFAELTFFTRIDENSIEVQERKYIETFFEETRQLDFEVMTEIIIDENNIPSLGSETIQGTEGNVRKLKLDVEFTNEELGLIHNHPGDFPPSMTDIETLMRREVINIFVITLPDGKVFFILKTGERNESYVYRSSLKNFLVEAHENNDMDKIWNEGLPGLAYFAESVGIQIYQGNLGNPVFKKVEAKPI